MFQRNKFMEEDFFIPYRFHLLNKAGLLAIRYGYWAIRQGYLKILQE